MKDTECVRFMQWALPRLRMRWPGFRKVRRQVCKRINQRIRELRLNDVECYHEYLQVHQDEWIYLDSLCRISISRFYRDKGVFDCIGNKVLPALAQLTANSGNNTIKCWSAGSASGEEAYTIALVWQFVLSLDYPDIGIHITGTEVDNNLLGRAERAYYPQSSVKDLPEKWLSQAFNRANKQYCLYPEFREKVNFISQDIRRAAPDGPFHIVLCRNLAFTYFDISLQKKVLGRIFDSLLNEGILVIGIHELLPDGITYFRPWISNMGIYRKAFV
jgi:chemotaxis protein methyltransferase CheR